MTQRFLLVSICFLICSHLVWGQSKPDPKADSLSKFDKFNAKAEHFFKVFPVPLVAYSTDAGQILGLAKFNTFRLDKKDTISRPSKISEVATFSTKGRINISVANDLIFQQEKYMILSYFNYKEQPEYIFGLGNDVVRDSVEQIFTNRIKFATAAMMRVKGHFYAGVGLELANYFGIKTDSDSYLVRNNVTGLHGGTNFGIGFAGAMDNRDNRYNASKGALILTQLVFYPKAIGSTYQFTKFELDLRKYFKPWKNLKHVVAVQASTNASFGDVPYYDLALLGGESKMRGYLQGAYRDNVLVDSQVEYRMPVWKTFGIVGWVGTGRVGHSYSDLALSGFRFSYGGGIRIRVDSGSNVNLRLDMGFGGNGVKGFYINFAEAF